ncbi:hypothetical protein YB2330_003100 [Saitoella coloradoensis]
MAVSYDALNNSEDSFIVDEVDYAIPHDDTPRWDALAYLIHLDVPSSPINSQFGLGTGDRIMLPREQATIPLISLLKDGKPEHNVDIWYMYRYLPRGSLDANVRGSLLEYYDNLADVGTQEEDIFEMGHRRFAFRNLHVLADFPESDLTVTDISYKIRALCRLDRLEEACAVFDRLVSMGGKWWMHGGAESLLLSLKKSRQFSMVAQIWRKAYDASLGSWPVQRNAFYSALFNGWQRLSEWAIENINDFMTTTTNGLDRWHRHVAREVILYHANLADKPAALFANDLLKLVRKAGSVVGVLEYTATISALSKANLPRLAVSLYNDMLAIEKHKPNQVTVNVMLRVYDQLHDFRSMQQLFDDLADQHIQPGARSYSIIMMSLARHGLVELVEALYNQFKESGQQPNEYIFAALMFARTMRLEVDQVKKWSDIAQRHGIKDSIVLHHMVLNVYSQTGDLAMAVKSLKTMIAAGVVPNNHVFSSMVALFARRKDIDGAVMCFEWMQQGLRLKPDATDVGALLNAYVEVGDMKGADDFFRAISESYGVKRTVAHHNIMMKGWMIQKNSGKVLATYDAMRDAELRPDAETYNMLIQAHCAMNEMGVAEDCLRRMRASDRIKPNAYHYTTLMAAYLRRQDTESCSEVFEQMLDDGVQPTFVTYTVVMQLYLSRGDPIGLQRANDLLEEIFARRDRLDLTSKYAPRTSVPPFLFMPVLKKNSALYGSTAAREVFDRFIDVVGALPDLQMLTTLMVSYHRGNSYEMVERLWKLIRARAYELSRTIKVSSEGIELDTAPMPNSRHLCEPLLIYLQSLREQRAYDKVDEVCAGLLQDGYAFDAAVWNSLVTLYAESERLHLALRIVEEKLIVGNAAYNENHADMETGMISADYTHVEYYVYSKAGQSLQEAVTRNLRGHGGKGGAMYDELFKKYPRTMSWLERFGSRRD